MLSLILPVRDWHLERVHACLDSFIALKAPSLTEIIVVDFGSEEPIVLRDGMSDIVKVLRLEASTWSLSEAINAGTLEAKNNLIAKTDADILIAPGSTAEFEAMVADLVAKKIGLGVCQATDLHQSLSVEQALEQVLAGDMPMGRLRAKWGQGGLVFFDRDYWNDIGGFESRFTGWGNEDNDFAERVRGFGRPIKWADPEALQIFHVWHPPTHALTGILAQRQRNQKIASNDKSILRPVVFRHSNYKDVARPNIIKARPLVTLGIATTARPNSNRMVNEAINSFRGQIDNEFEIVLVDNGSTADEFEALRESVKKVKWAQGLINIVHTDVASIPGARNIITAESRGRYITVVDDDDLALPNRLADHLANFEKNGRLHGSHGGWIDFDETTGVIERNSGKKRTAPVLLAGTGKITAHPASFYRADAMKAVPYDESFQLGSDLDLALRMATMGMEIGHTNSFVTLRRYHSANVTITGTSNQASNGATARVRANATYGWDKQVNLKEAAKEDDKDVFCRNAMTLETLTKFMPKYTGEWVFMIPIQKFTDEDGEMDYKKLDQIEKVAGGTLCTRKGGGALPIYYRSNPVRTLAKARVIQAELETVVGDKVEIISKKQADLDRCVPIVWKNLPVESGCRRLKSESYKDLNTLMVDRSLLDLSVEERGLVALISDYSEEEGEFYFLITDNHKGFEAVNALQHKLNKKGEMNFVQVIDGGVENELTWTPRTH